MRIVTEALDPQESTDQGTPTPTASQGPELGLHTETQSSSELYFYLLKPTTATASQVLIPVRAEATLTESLRNQTVLEYPTINVLPNPPEAVGEGLMLETEYVETNDSHDRIRARRAGNEDQAHSSEQQATEKGGDAPLDAKSILAMLKRDIAL
jgi:hypothetical protein